MNRLHAAYAERGLEILSFPCNQFLMQEPQSAETVACARSPASRRAKADGSAPSGGFHFFEKIHVNGPNAHPVYRFLRLKSGDMGPIGWKCVWLCLSAGSSLF